MWSVDTGYHLFSCKVHISSYPAYLKHCRCITRCQQASYRSKHNKNVQIASVHENSIPGQNSGLDIAWKSNPQRHNMRQRPHPCATQSPPPSSPALCDWVVSSTRIRQKQNMFFLLHERWSFSLSYCSFLPFQRTVGTVPFLVLASPCLLGNSRRQCFVRFIHPIETIKIKKLGSADFRNYSGDT